MYNMYLQVVVVKQVIRLLLWVSGELLLSRERKEQQRLVNERGISLHIDPCKCVNLFSLDTVICVAFRHYQV